MLLHGQKVPKIAIKLPKFNPKVLVIKKYSKYLRHLKNYCMVMRIESTWNDIKVPKAIKEVPKSNKKVPNGYEVPKIPKAPIVLMYANVYKKYPK